MMSPKIGAIGFMISVSFILCAVSTFTKRWITWSYGGVSFGLGIVPYESNEPTWFAASSWLMFISFGLFFPLFLAYLHASYKVHHHGCCHGIRHNFSGISLLCSLIVILEAVAFILMAINASDLSVTYYRQYVSATLGYSAYLAIGSAICATVAMSLAGHVSRHDCH